MLKAELRNMERSQKREGVDLTYLKNVILKLLETGTHVGRSITKRELFFPLSLIEVLRYKGCSKLDDFDYPVEFSLNR